MITNDAIFFVPIASNADEFAPQQALMLSSCNVCSRPMARVDVSKLVNNSPRDAYEEVDATAGCMDLEGL